MVVVSPLVGYTDPGKYKDNPEAYLQKCEYYWNRSTSDQKPTLEAHLLACKELYNLCWNIHEQPVGPRTANIAVSQKQKVNVEHEHPLFESMLYWAVTNPWSVILIIIAVGLFFYGFDLITNHSGLVDPILAAKSRGEFVSDFTISVNRIWATVLTFSELFISLFWFVLYRGFILNPRNISERISLFVITLFGLLLSIIMLYVDTYISAVAMYGPVRVPPLNQVPINEVDILVFIAAIMPTPFQTLIFEYLRIMLEKRRTDRKALKA